MSIAKFLHDIQWDEEGPYEGDKHYLPREAPIPRATPIPTWKKNELPNGLGEGSDHHHPLDRRRVDEPAPAPEHHKAIKGTNATREREKDKIDNVTSVLTSKNGDSVTYVTMTVDSSPSEPTTAPWPVPGASPLGGENDSTQHNEGQMRSDGALAGLIVGSLLGGMAFVSLLICLGYLGWRTSKRKRKKRLQGQGKTMVHSRYAPRPSAPLPAVEPEAAEKHSSLVSSPTSPSSKRRRQPEETVSAATFKDAAMFGLSRTMSDTVSLGRTMRASSVEENNRTSLPSRLHGMPLLPSACLGGEERSETSSCGCHYNQGHVRGHSLPLQYSLGKVHVFACDCTISACSCKRPSSQRSHLPFITSERGPGSSKGSIGHAGGVVNAIHATFRKASPVGAGNSITGTSLPRPPHSASSSASRWDPYPVFESIVMAPTYRRASVPEQGQEDHHLAPPDPDTIKESESVRGAASVMAKFEREEEQKRKLAEAELEDKRREQQQWEEKKCEREREERGSAENFEQEEEEDEVRRRALDICNLTRRLEEIESFNSMTGMSRSPLRLVHGMSLANTDTTVSEDPRTPRASHSDVARMDERSSVISALSMQPSPQTNRVQANRPRIRDSLVRKFRSVPSLSVVDRLLGESSSFSTGDEDETTEAERQWLEQQTGESTGDAYQLRSSDTIDDFDRKIERMHQSNSPPPELLISGRRSINGDDGESNRSTNYDGRSRTTSSSPMKLHREESMWMGSSSSRRLSRATASSTSLAGALARSPALLPSAEQHESITDTMLEAEDNEEQDEVENAFQR